MGSYAFSRSHPKAKPGTNNGTLQIFRERSEERSETTPVWIHQVESDFGITGSFGQSVGKRDFYPRNFNQPSYRFYGQTHNENEYGDLCEFIRRGQLESIFGGASGTTPILMRIKLPVAGVTMTWVGRGRRSRVKRRINRNLKGERPPIWLEG